MCRVARMPARCCKSACQFMLINNWPCGCHRCFDPFGGLSARLLNRPLTIRVCYWLTIIENYGMHALRSTSPEACRTADRAPTTGQSRRRHPVLRRTDFRPLRGLAVQAAELVRSYSGLTLKVLFKDGDALITRARASLISQFLDDPDGDPPVVCRRRYRFRAGAGCAPDRVRCRNVRGGLSDQTHRLGQGEENHRNRAPQSGCGGAEICV